MTDSFDDFSEAILSWGRPIQPIGRLNILIGDLFAFAATGVAIGAVVFSIKPLYQTIKDRKWSDLPLLSVPFLIGTYMIDKQSLERSLQMPPAKPALALLNAGQELVDDQWNWDEIFEWDDDDDGDWDDDEE
jgi:hypothetical protein